MREEAEMMPVAEDFRWNQESVFFKVYFAHLLEQQTSYVCDSVNMAYRLAAVASLNLAGVEEVKDMLNEKPHR